MPDSLLYVDRDMVEPDLVQLPGGTVAVCSARCPGKIGPNEDAAALIPFGPDAAVLAVADGLGGIAAGEQASRAAVQALQQTIHEAAREGMLLRSAIISGIEHANQAVQQLGLGAATTLAIVEISGEMVRPYHIGDSVVLITGQRGRVKLETISHSPVGYAVASGMLDHDEAMHHEDRHLVSNVIGSPEMRIEIGPAVKLCPRDTLLVATDGLLDNLHAEEIIEHVRKGRLQRAIQTLIAEATLRMQGRVPGPSKPDDITVVAYRRTP